MEKVEGEQIHYGFSIERERFGSLKVKIPKIEAFVADVEELEDEDEATSMDLCRHICFECGKEFKSGKALGGHKRIHGIESRKLIRPKMIIGNGVKDELENNVSGEIGVIACSVCKKNFTSRKALYGHMRYHPDRGWRGILPPSYHQQFLLPSIPSSSISSLSTDHDHDDELIISSSYDDVDVDDDQQLELCDTMKLNYVIDLKETLKYWTVTGKRGRKSLSKAELKPLEEKEEEEDMTDGIGNLLYFANGAEAKLDLAMEEKSDNIMKKKKKRSLSEMEEKEQSSTLPLPLPQEQLDTTSTAREKHVCVTCNKSFTSYQALGGHRASHNKVKTEFQAKGSGQEACGLLGNEVTGQGTSGSSSGNNNGDHICNICFKSFPTGQALGGHKRCHWTGPISSETTTTTAAITAVSSSQVKETVQKIKLQKTMSFDLNELPKE